MLNRGLLSLSVGLLPRMALLVGIDVASPSRTSGMADAAMQVAPLNGGVIVRCGPLGQGRLVGDGVTTAVMVPVAGSWT